MFNRGHTVNFTNTIVVMTSNIGSQLIQQISQEGGSEAEIRQAVREGLQARFLPEFINRIDETIVFHPLTREQIGMIVDLQIKRLAAQLDEKGLALVVTEAARNQISAEGYDPTYGARPLKRLIQRRIQNPLATEILKGRLEAGSTLKIDYRDGDFAFDHVDQAETVVETESVT